MQPDLRKREREHIFKLFLTNERLKFSQIEKSLGIRSNMVSYHLECMMKDHVLEKEGEYYRLSKESERFIPYFPNLAALPVLLVAITKGKKILLCSRIKRPYKGYWGLVGGRLLVGESIEQGSLRLAREKGGLDTKFRGVASVMHEHVKEKGQPKHSFLLILTKLEAKGSSKQEGVRWFESSKLSKLKIIPSDLYLMEKRLSSEIEFEECELEDANGHICKASIRTYKTSK